MRKGNSDPLTAHQTTRLAELEAMPDEAIDTTEIPEVRNWSKVTRGKYYKPKQRRLTLVLDDDLADLFSSENSFDVNAALRFWLDAHPHIAPKKKMPEAG